VNAVNKGVIRTKKEVKRKWQDLCCETRKKESTRKREANGTGGGEAPKPLTEVQEKVLLKLQGYLQYIYIYKPYSPIT
jgi:hypothetical protein